MKNNTRRFFHIYAKEDASAVYAALKELQDELKVKLSSGIDGYSFELNDDTYKGIEDAEFVFVFIGNESHNDDYFCGCVTHSHHMNKNITPVKLTSSVRGADKFAFRSKPYCFADKESKSMLFAQLKMLLGLNVEKGENFGALVRIKADVHTAVLRDDNILCYVWAGRGDTVIRLAKGKHQLTFKEWDAPYRKYSETFTVENSYDELRIDVNMERNGKKWGEEIAQTQEKKEKNQESLLQWLVLLFIALTYLFIKYVL